jgi:hypothetical protein
VVVFFATKESLRVSALSVSMDLSSGIPGWRTLREFSDFRDISFHFRENGRFFFLMLMLSEIFLIFRLSFQRFFLHCVLHPEFSALS